MWDRKTVKARGKEAFQANYWRCVLIALILFAVMGGGAATGKRSGSGNGAEDMHFESFQEFKDYFQRETGVTGDMMNRVLVAVGAVVGAVVLVGSALKLLVFNPLKIGCCHFFVRNGESPAELGEIDRAFKPAWVHNFVVMLLHDLFIALWSLLLVVPGIIKAYAYRLTPYLQAENPDLSGVEAIRLSERMMKGHKWEAFVYDLSFLGWYLLSVLTFGLLAVLYVNPYKEAADAELYREISESFLAASGQINDPEL